MKLFILDTDHLSQWQRSHTGLLQRLSSLPPEQLAITIVTAEEQLRGRLAQVNRQPHGPARVQAYQLLRQALIACGKLPVLPYDDAADQRYRELRQRYPRLGSQDLRIAAITFTQSATLVTNNLVDFAQIDGLSIVNWLR